MSCWRLKKKNDIVTTNKVNIEGFLSWFYLHFFYLINKKTWNANYIADIAEFMFPDEEQAREQQLERESAERANYVAYDNIPMGLTHYKDRLFITVPRRRPGIPATLNTISSKSTAHSSPSLRAYPNYRTNELLPNGSSDPNRLVSVYRTRIDACNRLWFIDTGMLEYPSELLSWYNMVFLSNSSFWKRCPSTGSTTHNLGNGSRNRRRYQAVPDTKFNRWDGQRTARYYGGRGSQQLWRCLRLHSRFGTISTLCLWVSNMNLKKKNI